MAMTFQPGVRALPVAADLGLQDLQSIRASNVQDGQALLTGPFIRRSETTLIKPRPSQRPR
jgi:hypothetical protein